MEIDPCEKRRTRQRNQRRALARPAVWAAIVRHGLLIARLLELLLRILAWFRS